MAEDETPRKKLKALEITCSSADCKSGLHCFRTTKKMKTANQAGRCRYCGAELIDWQRVRKRDLGDSVFTFDMLKYELWRHYYWHIPIDDKAINHARRKGKAGMRVAAEKRIRSSVGSANPYRDGMQTPKTGNVLYYAQHATSTCCRKCIEDWHGIPMQQDLDEGQIRYFKDLLMLYVEARLPFLTESGEHVPARRKDLEG